MIQFDQIQERISVSLRSQTKKTRGFAVGLAAGIVILLLGFWQTLFLLACGLAGLYIGWRLDCGESLRSIAARILPERFGRGEW